MTDNERQETDKKQTDVEQTETWAEDQKARKYYYDDATGYEKYDPAEDDDETEDELS